MKKIILIILAVGTNILAKAQECPQMVFVEGSTFVMGETCEPYRDEKKQPKTRITLESFKISKTEVTKGQWEVFSPRTFESDWDNNDDPATGISWYKAIEYCEWLSKKTGKTYRLPTEAEWEFAARGGKKSKGYKYSGGNDLNTVAWFYDNSNTNPNPHAIRQHSIHKVGSKKPNELGLYDMSGNVSEWCYYHCSTQFESSRISRGGNYLSSDYNCTANWRAKKGMDSSDNGCGFRVVEVISLKELNSRANEIKKSLE